ncbi:hypothetical protein BJ508DRAFT_410648 [Ascobolus immersus RN42]|uniref:Protein YOP1 n=1 Tax=Ascobolus immersus RN42 TaxID=1160509 RepID=A0A3N4IZK4_ASCIM|nr:hypothetical protein BJ508DRAFT_410648 [Ascobolus immersus RN42]
MSFQDKVQQQLSNLDKELSKYPALNNLEKQTGAPKVYVVAGLGAIYFLLILVNYGGQFLTNLAGFALPAYYSFNSLVTISKVDDTQWITYWVTFGFLTLLESAISIVYWFPFYYTFKFAFLIWLQLPQFGGANVIFKTVLQPVLSKYIATGPAGSTASSLRAKVDAAGLGDKTL